MGGSGAGKSSLLNILSGRFSTGTMTGSVTLNGYPRNPDNWNTVCSFVERDDVILENLTVEEVLAYTARLRLDRSMSCDERIKHVNDIISALGLEALRHTKISSGLSVRKRKIVAIAIELLIDPHILFLDEPVSSLDSHEALELLQTIKKLTVEKKMIVLLTIHQPRTDILELFDRIIIMSMGKTVWNGHLNGI
jgi:ABC-type multidrug transport system ATPase subunit